MTANIKHCISRSPLKFQIWKLIFVYRAFYCFVCELFSRLQLVKLQLDHKKHASSIPVVKIRDVPFCTKYRGVDKSLARPGRKKVGTMSGTRAISTTSKRELSLSFIFSCKARRRRKFTPFWQKNYLVSFLVGLRTYQRPCIHYCTSQACALIVQSHVWTEMFNLESAFTEVFLLFRIYSACNKN